MSSTLTISTGEDVANKNPLEQPRTENDAPSSPPPPPPKVEEQEQQLVDTSFLPCFIRVIFHHLVGQYLYQSDDFVVFTRKVCGIAYLLGGIMGSLWFPFYLFLSSRDMTSDAALAAGKNPTAFDGTFHVPDLIMACSLLVFGLTVLSGYAALRVQKTVSEKVLVACVLGSGQLVTCTTFCSTDFDVAFYCTVLVAFVTLNDCPCKLLFNSWWLLLQLISYFNIAFDDSVGRGNQANTSSHFVFRHPDVRHREGMMRFWLLASGWTPMICILLVLQGVLNENKKQYNMSQRCTLLAQNVVAQLRRYNTDGARDVVQAEARGLLDENGKLREASSTISNLVYYFQELVNNLEGYRPFLPNYILNATCEGELPKQQHSEEMATAQPTELDILSDLADSGDLESVRSSQPTPTHRRESRSTANTSPVKCPGNISPPSRWTYSRRESTILPTPLPTADRRRSRASTQSPTSPLIRVADPLGVHFTGQISLALVELRTSGWFSRQLLKSNFDEDEGGSNVLSLFTDLLFDFAQTTKGSIHSVIGDTAQVTWNATHRVGQPEAKAAAFLLRLKQSLSGAAPDLQLSGACCSGTAEMHTMIASQTKQRALFLDAPWLPALDACYQLAKRYKTLVIDSRTEEGARYEVTTQAVDCIRYIPRVTSSSSTGLESTGEPLLPTVPTGTRLVLEPRLNPVGFDPAPPMCYDTLLGLKGPAEQQCSALLRKEMPSPRAAGPTIGPEKEDSSGAQSSPPACGHTIVYELLKTKQEEAELGEWMYVLQESESREFISHEHHVSQALKWIVNGEVSRAGHFLSEKMRAPDWVPTQLALRLAAHCQRQGDGSL